tara:strand:- start:2158 stop:2634 length:477 start_codon:yes stop_codon:yes gene_type:complete
MDNTNKILINKAKEQDFAKEIINIVQEYYDVNIFEDTNRHEVSIPRYISVYLVKKHTKKVTYAYLGKMFNRNESGLILSVNKFKESVQYDKERTNEVSDLDSLIKLSKGYGDSIIKNQLIKDTVSLLNDLNEPQIKRFFDIFSNYKQNNLEVISEEVN